LYHKQAVDSKRKVRARRERAKRDELLEMLSYGLLPRPMTQPLDEELVTVNGHEIGHSAIQGYRVNMEDKHVITELNIPNHTLMAVFDGHAGSEAAEIGMRCNLNVCHYARELIFCQCFAVSTSLLQSLQQQPDWEEYTDLINARTEINKTSDDHTITVLSKALVGAYISLDAELQAADVTSG
jgi:hypothetical protein